MNIDNGVGAGRPPASSPGDAVGGGMRIGPEHNPVLRLEDGSEIPLASVVVERETEASYLRDVQPLSGIMPELAGGSGVVLLSGESVIFEAWCRRMFHLSISCRRPSWTGITKTSVGFRRSSRPLCGGVREPVWAQASVDQGTLLNSSPAPLGSRRSTPSGRRS